MTNPAQYHLRMTSGLAKSGDLARIIYLGVSEGLTYIAPFVEELFFAKQQETKCHSFDASALQQNLANCDANLVILVAPSEQIKRQLGPRDIFAVSRIHQTVDTSHGLTSIHQSMSSREIKRVRIAKKSGFRWDISLRDEDFFAFYRGMHKPTMHSRYGDKARSVEEKIGFSLFKQGALFRVFCDDEWIAGSVGQINQKSKTLNSRLIGVKGGDVLYRNNGAQNFVYHAILEWAANEPEIDCVDFQGCEPFLTKGTFQYKKRFGTQAVIPDNLFGELRMLLRAPVANTSTRDFFINNPVLSQNPNAELIARYFYDNKHGIRSDIPFQSKGISHSISTNLDELFE